MIFNENTTLYDILDIAPDASPQEVRDAYVRIKTTYHKDSVVLYSLIGTHEREDILKRIEEAYSILSDTEKRRDYDRHYGVISSLENPFSPPVENETTEELLEDLSGKDDLLVPPSTDFNPSSSLYPSPLPPLSTEPDPGETLPISEPSPAHSFIPPNREFTAERARADQPSSDPDPIPPRAYTRVTRSNTPYKISLEKESKKTDLRRAPSSPAMAAVEQLIQVETEWSGPFLRKVRSTAQVSVEEMSEITKITRNYINAIEEENFERLPAAVYVRGFVIQIAKVLRLPPEKVASAYLSRYHAQRNAT